MPPDSIFDLSDQTCIESVSLYRLRASFSAISLGFITIFPIKSRSLGILAVSQPSEESIAGPIVSFLANRCPIPLGSRLGSIQLRSLLEYCPGCTSPSPYRSVAGKSSFIGWVDGSCRARSAYFLCLSSSSGTAGIRAASLTRGPIGVVDRAPVIDLAWRFISLWRSFAQVFWPRHQSSAPYRATDCTAAIWTLRTSPGDRP